MSTGEQDTFSWRRRWRAGALWVALLLVGVGVLYLASGSSDAVEPTTLPTEPVASVESTPTATPAATPTAMAPATPTVSRPVFPEPPEAQLTFEGETFVTRATDYCWPISPTDGEICAESDRGPAEEPGFQVQPGATITFHLDTDDAYTMGASFTPLVPHPQSPDWGLDWARPSIRLPVEASPDGWQITADAPDGEYELAVGIEMEVFPGHFGRASYYVYIVVGDPKLSVDFTGTITSIERGDDWVSLEVTSFPDEVTPGDVFIVGITTDTAIQHWLGEPGTMDDLKRGAEITATIVGEIAASDPPRGHAARLVITRRVIAGPLLLADGDQSQHGVLDGNCQWHVNEPICYHQDWMNLPDTVVTIDEGSLLTVSLEMFPGSGFGFTEISAYRLDAANLGTVRGMPVRYLDPAPETTRLYASGPPEMMTVPADLPEGEWAIAIRVQTTGASPTWVFRVRTTGVNEPILEPDYTGTIESIERWGAVTSIQLRANPDENVRGDVMNLLIHPGTRIFELTPEGFVRQTQDELQVGVRISVALINVSDAYPNQASGNEIVILERGSD